MLSLGGKMFQQIIDIPIDRNYAPLLVVDISIYVYETKFIQKRIKDKK
jgi:hypothetical protein